MKKGFYLLFLLALAGPILACGLPGSGDADATATIAALNTSIAESNAAPTTAPVEETVVEDEATATPDVAANVLAAQATATAQVIGATATALARTAEETGSQAATAQAVAPFLAELPVYGVDPNVGRMAWIHPPVTLQVQGYMTYDYANVRAATVAQDFVLASDITWNTQFGTTGCGFVLRSDGDQEENYDQYIALITRASSGEMLFTIMQDGEVKQNEITTRNVTRLDPNFQWQNDTTNRFAVVARGNTFSFYTNGAYLGDITPSVAFDRGFVFFVGLNESGTTTCQYDNSFLWLIE